MSAPPCCVSGSSPVVHEYSRKGEIVKIGSMDVYVVGSGSAGVIVVPDIFGFEFNQLFQVCDRIADAGFVTAMPDVFEGKPYSMADFPPSDDERMAKLNTFFGTTCEAGKVRGQVREVMDWLKAERGAAVFGVNGHCWGSSISFSFANDPSVKAVSCCHPAFLGKETQFAEAAEVPVCILPAKGDPMEDAQQILLKKPFADKCVFQRFDDQEHGFMAARGDWTKPEIAEAAGKAVGVLTDFFKANVTAA